MISFVYHNRFSFPMFTRICWLHITTDFRIHIQQEYTQKNIISFSFKLNEIWSKWQFSFGFRTKLNYICFQIKRKTVTRIISHSIWRVMEMASNRTAAMAFICCHAFAAKSPSIPHLPLNPPPPHPKSSLLNPPRELAVKPFRKSVRAFDTLHIFRLI